MLNPLFMFSLAFLAYTESAYPLLAISLASLALLFFFPQKVGQVWAHPMAAILGGLLLVFAPAFAAPAVATLIAFSLLFSPVSTQTLLDDVAEYCAPAAAALMALNPPPWYDLEIAFSPPTGKLRVFLHTPGVKGRHEEGEALTELAQRTFKMTLPSVNTYSYSTKRFHYTMPSSHALIEGHERLAS